jgi:hypothetical protein
MSDGLLIHGIVVPVPGVIIVSAVDAAWAHLSPGDCRPRSSSWVRQWVLHKTIADDPEIVLPGGGPSGGQERTAEYWLNDPHHSGAHGVTGHDGVAACLCDLAKIEAYHATVSNAWSVGWETCELPGGKVYRDALNATIAICLAGCEVLGIQFQIPSRTYNGHPIKRMINGGPDMVGIFGHRDNTEDRGEWDPGNTLFQMLLDRGCEAFDFDAGEDIAVWKQRQADLNTHGHNLTVDGVPGPATTVALAKEGYRSGIWALGRTA